MKGLYNLEIPTADADIMSAGRPNKISRDIVKIQYDMATEAESERFDALEQAGFRVDRTTPLMDNIMMRYGGYYIDIGASAHIVRGEIKVKSGVPITTFTPEGLHFQDGSELKADVVVIATGQDHDYRNQVGNIVGKDFASKLGEFWGLDEEGEIRNVMKPAGKLVNVSSSGRWPLTVNSSWIVDVWRYRTSGTLVVSIRCPGHSVRQIGQTASMYSASRVVSLLRSGSAESEVGGAD